MVSNRSKDALRRIIRDRRARVAAEEWERLGASLCSHLLALLPSQPGVIALYAARDDEPPTRPAIDALTARGWQVLLPRLGRRPDWAWFTGWDNMTTGYGGIPQPDGAPLGAEALARADAVVVPCLGGSRDGVRLGTGGGWYDRALLHRAERAPVWAVARASEVMDVPAEAHDVPVDRIITEQGVLVCG